LYLNREGKAQGEGQDNEKDESEMYLKMKVRPYLVNGDEKEATKAIAIIEHAGMANKRPLLASGVAPEPRGENIVIFVAGNIGNLSDVIDEALERDGVDAKMLSDEDAENILNNITEDDIYR